MHFDGIGKELEAAKSTKKTYMKKRNWRFFSEIFQKCKEDASIKTFAKGKKKDVRGLSQK